MNYIFGEWSDRPTTATEIRAILSRATAGRAQFSQAPLSKIIDVLDRVGNLWRPGLESGFFEKALKQLPQEVSFSTEMIRMSLELIPEILSESSLSARVKADFENPLCLDEFSRRGTYQGLVKFSPHGVLLHVSAGNIFIGAIDSLVQALMTKNISIVKVSSRNQTFPRLFAESVVKADSEGLLSRAFAFIHWQGGNEEIETVLKNEVDAIIAWGGGEMISSYKKNLRDGIPFIEHGPKFSLQVVTEEGAKSKSLKDICKNIARDLSLWDQSACSSPQNLFIQKQIDSKSLMDLLAVEMDLVPWSRGRINQEEQVEILKEEHRALMTQAEGFGFSKKTKNSFLHFDPRPGVRVSPLNRTLIIKIFENRDDLIKQILPISRNLQTCGYLFSEIEKPDYLNELARIGVTRFSPIGKMLEGQEGAPHDGRLSLTELGRFVGDEEREDVLSFTNNVVHNNAFYKNIYEGKNVNQWTDLIPLAEIQKIDVEEYRGRSGYLFSSGGTSGSPKYVFYSHDEFENTAKMLAQGFLLQGLKKGDVCANLFVAGNMWSSFMVVEKALAKCETTQLPIGGLAESELILAYLKKFKPDAVFGLPSILVELAMKSEREGLDLNIAKIFYAGEHLTEQGRRTLTKIWKVEKIGSAGYATVDAGPIGYQCAYTKSREYHLFQDQVHLEIIGGEGLVTSLVRKEMPVIHLKVGDHLEWVSEKDSCMCGKNDKKFILHGRVDGQIRMWSSKILWQEIEAAFLKSEINAPVIQIILEDPELMTIRFETPVKLKAGDLAKFRNEFYTSCIDLAATQSREFLDSRLRLEVVKLGELPHVARTQKVKPIIDKRII